MNPQLEASIALVQSAQRTLTDITTQLGELVAAANRQQALIDALLPTIQAQLGSPPVELPPAE